jgi:hypothetical protein
VRCGKLCLGQPFKKHGIVVGNSARQVVNRSQEKVSCQICLENGHLMSKYLMDSGSWLDSKHRGWFCSPQRARRRAVHHRFWWASQLKNLTQGGTQYFHMCLQAGHGREPWKVARYMEGAVYVPLAVHLQSRRSGLSVKCVPSSI